MNYLAHFLLAAPRDEWIAGGLAGDFVKGPLTGSLPPGIEQGIVLHRRIDACSDSLPKIRDFRMALPPAWRRYAGPVLDLMFDQQLARNWNRFHDRCLLTFSREVDDCLSRHARWLEPGGRRFARRLREHRLLPRYVDDAVIHGALQSLANRSRSGQGLLAAYAGLRQREAEVAQLFQDSFPAIRQAAESCKRSLSA